MKHVLTFKRMVVGLSMAVTTVTAPTVATAAAGDAAACKDHRASALDRLEIRAFAGQQGRMEIPNPFPDGLKGCQPTLCWLTPEQAANGRKCAEALPPDKSLKVFSIGVNVEKTENGVKKPDFTELQMGRSEPHLIDPKPSTIAVIYKPDGLSSRRDEAVLRIEWNDPTDGDVYFITGQAEAYQDARYRISLWGGVAYLYSKDNFSKTFPEVRLLVETRVFDRDQREEYCRQVPTPEDCTPNKDSKKGGREKPKYQRYKFTRPWGVDNVRLYGDLGLTGTTALTNAELSSTSFDGARAFDGSFGIGLGRSFHVASKDHEHDTWKFSVMFPLVRIGIASLPEAEVPTNKNFPAVEPMPYSDSFGARIENENGHFAGAYTEIGIGQSNRFVYQKTSRLKVDAFLPFSEPGTVRLGARLQIDRRLPGASLNDGCYGSVATPCPVDDKVDDKLLRAGEIKITLLFNIDIRTLFDLLGAPSSTKQK
jgi:hypothetical protein